MEAATTSRHELIPEWAAAEAKLRKHGSLLGFRKVPKSDVFALSPAFRRPSIQQVIQKYKAGRQWLSATHHACSSLSADQVGHSTLPQGVRLPWHLPKPAR